MNKKKCCETFDIYASQYNLEDVKIRLKRNHMYRVADLCQQIANSLKLPSEDVDLAWLIGLLHDIGRFEQIKKYGTFVDRDSCDHAALSTSILFHEGLIHEFTSERLDIIKEAVKDHSMYRLPTDLDPTCQFFCRILRDGDKLDIFRVMTETPLEEIYNVSTEALYNSSVTAEVKECFLQGHAVLRSLKKTPIDHLVGHICLFFELEFEASKSIARDAGYLAKMLNFKSRNGETLQWFEHMSRVLGFHY